MRTQNAVGSSLALKLRRVWGSAQTAADERARERMNDKAVVQRVKECGEMSSRTGRPLAAILNGKVGELHHWPPAPLLASAGIMLAARGAQCLLCEMRAISGPVMPPAWQPQRHFSQVKKRRPDRMTLSPRVARASPQPTTSGKPRPRREQSPFGAMNRTDPGARLAKDQRRSEAAAKREPTWGRPSKGGKQKKERQPGDQKALRMQRSLHQVPYGHRSQVKARIDEIDSFKEFPLLPTIQESIPAEALKGLTEIGPTPIQRLAIPALLGFGDKKGRRSMELAASGGMKQFLLAAETGSGKTLAYLLPTVDAIKRAETADKIRKEEEAAADRDKKKQNLFDLEPPPLSSDPHPDAGRPRAIVLLPTSELVDQVGAVFKSFSHTVKMRVAMLSSAYSATVIRNRLFAPSGVDVVISTPHLLSNIADADPNVLSRVTHLIIDEADSLLDKSFTPLTTSILDRAEPSLKQLILCSATIPRSLDSALRKRFPDIERLATPNLHAIPRRVQLSVIDIDKDPYRGNRDLACADTIWSIGKSSGEPDTATRAADDGAADPQPNSDTKRILVFVNEREQAAALADYLVTKGVDAAAMSRDTPLLRHSEILAAFTSTAPVPVSRSAAIVKAYREPTAQRILPHTKVLVMTDLGARGIDTVAVRNVVLYDVPHTSIDFIHRLGRTGRMGRRGRGFVLVGKGDRRDVVREVREGMFRGQALI
ncbi:hypothetical protein FH972_026668 [Carpinus fangiana]|uniref:RNA helicase n=1 Tax=Carpinus fangiana TaxID=176857 RepID=A0A5N6L539_9ROSI|nr:hypothetical protein FH972_026668 [Carpinus fangiana]